MDDELSFPPSKPELASSRPAEQDHQFGQDSNEARSFPSSLDESEALYSGEEPDEALPVGESAGDKAKTALREMAETLFLALLIFFTVRGAIQNFKVEGSSMEPALHHGQYLLVNKLSYLGLNLHDLTAKVERLPVTVATRLGLGQENVALSEPSSNGEGVFFPFGLPDRGDIIVFRFPRDPSRDFIKRVVGLPGEQVEIRAGVVYINGKKLNEPYILENPTYSRESSLVPPGNYFVLGDNRNNSSDSHVWGSVPLENIVGKTWFSYWPWKDVGPISGMTAVAGEP